jgi:N-acetyl sugar amidotransferase
MKYCKRCLYPENHPLGICLDERGVCSGCRIHEEKDRLNWNSRLEKLKSILSGYRSKLNTNYDCIVPVNGARDSFFIVHTVKNILGMNPLLVSYNKHYNTDEGIYNFAQLRMRFNCDCLMKTIDPAIVIKLTRTTLKVLGSMYWHCLAGETVYPVETAVRLKIPLIIWGIHQGCDQVGMFSHLDEVEMTRKYRKNHDLMGYEAEDLLSENNDLSLRDIEPFKYPNDKEIESVGVRGIYLSNYIRWDTMSQHEQMIHLYDYKTARLASTFDCYNDIDSVHYSGIHDYLKLIKHGYGKVMDHACREIRFKRMTRKEGIELVIAYQRSPLKDLDRFLSWLDMSASEFDKIIMRHRNLSIWENNNERDWKIIDPVSNYLNDDGIDSVRLEQEDHYDFINNPLTYETERDGEYVLFGKGYRDF